MEKVFPAIIAAVVMAWLCSIPYVAQAETKPIELKLAQWDPPHAKIAKLTQKMADMINEKSGGRIKVVTYFGETLLKQAESYRSTQLGVADMSYFGPTAAGSPVVLGRVISLPFLGLTSHEMATEVYERLLAESPELRAEYKGLKVMGLFGIPLDNFHTTKKAIRVPADAKGVKILALGPRVDFMKEIGASPVTMGVGDWYTSLERGLVDGMYFLFPVLPIFKLEDLFKYHTVVNASAGVNMFIFNERRWNSLPPDLQKVIEEAARWRVGESHKNDRSEDEGVIASLKNKGHVFYYPTAEEMKLWQAAAKPVHEKWIADNEARGLPARKVYEQLVTIIQQYKK